MAEVVQCLGDQVGLNDTHLGVTDVLFPRHVRGGSGDSVIPERQDVVYDEIARRLLFDISRGERESSSGRSGGSPEETVSQISSELSSLYPDGPSLFWDLADAQYTVRNLDADKVAFVQQSNAYRKILTTALQKKYASVMICWEQSGADTLTVAVGPDETSADLSNDLQTFTFDVEMTITNVFRDINTKQLIMSPKVWKEVNQSDFSTCLPHTSDDVLVIPSEDMSGFTVTGTSYNVTSVTAVLLNLVQQAEKKCICDLAQEMVSQASAAPYTREAPNERRISVERSILLFLQTHRSQEMDLIHKLTVGISVDLNTNTIIIRGQEGQVKEAGGQINSLISKVIAYSYISRKAGAKKYFRSQAGKQTIDAAQNTSMCIVDMIDNYPEWHGETRVLLKVGNLHTTEADVIVNSTNEKLDLSSGSLDNSLTCIGGSSIQRQCKMLYPNGIREGDVVRTGSGDLPCKELYHCCLPKWQSGHDTDKVLRQIIRQCLRKASEAAHSSIAFPALGTGTARYPPDVVATVLKDEAEEYLTANPCCSLKEVVVVLLDKDEETLQIFNRTFGDDTQRVNSLPDEPAELQNGAAITTSLSSACGSLFKVGDLAKTECDVIVNTTNGTLDLSVGGVSKRLVSVGGAIIQTQCKKLYPNGIRDGEVASTGPGKLHCKELYHCCLPEWKSAEYTGKLLRLTIHLCLHKAEIGKRASIAFPALGTGLRKYPAEVVATAFRDVVTEYRKTNPHSSLKNIGVVLFEKDRKTLQIFNTICSKIIEPGRETLIPDVKEQREFHVGDMLLEVKEGHILEQEVDAVVLPTELNDMAVPDPKIRRSGIAFVPREDGASIIAASREYCGYDVELMITKCLRKADREKVVSVALPHIAGNTAEDLFNFAFIRCILNIVNNNDRLKHVRRLILVHTNTLAVEETARMLQYYFGTSCMTGFRLGGPVSQTWGNKRERTMQDELHLRIVSGDRSNINQCRQFLEEQLEENLCVEVLDNEVISGLTDKQQKDIKQTCADLGVEAEVDIDNRLVRYSGLKTDVEKAMFKTGELIKDIACLQIQKEKAEFLRQFVQWWAAAPEGAMKMSAMTNVLIEEAYVKRHRQPTAVVKTLLGNVNIDFTTMELVPQIKPKYRIKLSRKQIAAMALPPSWEDMCGKDLIAPCVTSGSEYDELTHMFSSSAGTVYDIVMIRRIQNLLSYQQFQIQRQCVQARTPQPFEKRLWHGTRRDALSSINRNGFNRSFHGKNGTKFGKGVYFATEASYSAKKELSPKDDQGFKYIYLCRVLTGNFTKGDEKMLDTPFMDMGNSIRYDSVVDNVKTPTMHVVFRDTQAYPEYLFVIKER